MEDQFVFHTPLYDSEICRLCGLRNSEGVNIYDKDVDLDLEAAINRYLPIKVADDGKLPRTVCPGCHIQITATVQFFNLIIKGQKNIRNYYMREMKIMKEESALRRKLADATFSASVTSSPADASFLFKIIPKEPFFGEDHQLTLLVQGLDRPKRRPGRPRKQTPALLLEEETPADNSSAQPIADPAAELFQDEGIASGRMRRKRKVPSRFSEVVAGREMEKVLLEEGAIDEFDVVSSWAEEEKPTAESNDVASNDDQVVIGHLQNADGELAAPILVQPGKLPRRKKRSKKTRARLECDFCDQTFAFRNKWIKHRATHKTCAYHCLQEACPGIFTSKKKLLAHQEEMQHAGFEIVNLGEDPPPQEDNPIDDQGPYFCDSCGAITTSSSEMAAHQAAEHPQFVEEPGLATAIDEEQQETTPQIEDNSKSVSDEPNVTAEEKPTGKAEKRVHRCELCWKEFSHTASLIYHKESVHNNGTRFVCSKCPKSFAHKLLLKRHQTAHSTLRPFSCKKCDASFKSKSNLMNHQVVHSGEKKHTCDYCGQAFIHKTSLNLHVQAHQGLKPFQCPICEKSFAQFGNLNDHLRIHYGHKPFVCNICGKAFTTSSQQKLHYMRHTGERPWKCKYCGKRYLHKDTWKTHERRHTGEKPFECAHCMKSFSEVWSLRKHIRLHTGEKPYKCDVCGKDFADCSNLTKHKKVHANNGEKSAKTAEVKRPVANKEVSDPVFYIVNETGAEEDTLAMDNREHFVTFSDEDGNPLRLPLPDGRTADVLSFDLKKNIVEVRLNDGNLIVLELSRRFNNDAELLECVRDSVASMKTTTVPMEIAEEFEQRPKISNDGKLASASPNLTLENGIQIDDLGRAFIYSVDGEDKSITADFADGLNNVYFVANE